ncbi:MAG: bifunctional folylpolyglutamate synthase/dihydrofolate synthase [Candidatus Omnitrophica bacterium]|nr:bifunctional folylpolyglutamate synthase/dihydrofolate synthase [Candidatus Omnitrophota bacterium]
MDGTETAMSYEEAVAFLDTLTNYERVPKPQEMRAVRLDRMRRLCRLLGDPQRSFRSVLVTGTNGKGSICAMVYSMLRESRLRAGLYTSPHLEQVRERIRVWSDGPSETDRVHGDDWISQEEFAAVVDRLRPALETLCRETPEQPPTYFEAMTAAAFLHFRQRQVEVAVLEVGLGGRLDATNVVDEAVAVIGPIDVDHAEVLGDEPGLIAKEKAGIIKPGCSVITATQREQVMPALLSACEAQGAPLFICGQDLTASVQRHALDGLAVSITGFRGIYPSLRIPLIGRHQAQNAAIAVGALELLADTGIPHRLVERGLARVDWPGRIEVVSEAPRIIMDGAHNPHAAAALFETLAEFCQGRAVHLLIGMSSDKSAESLGRLLGGLCVSATCTQSRHSRALDPVELARRLTPFCPDVHVMSDPVDAYTYLLNAVSPDDVIVVTGSLFLVGELRAALRQAHVRSRRPAEPQFVG